MRDGHTVTRFDGLKASAAMGLIPAIAGFATLYTAAALPELLGTAMPPAVVAATLVLGATLTLLSAIDFKTFRLPDWLTLPLAAAGLAITAILTPDQTWLWRAGAAAAGYLTIRLMDWAYQRVRGQTGIGQGDAKLFAAAGAWVGFEGLPGTLLYACGGALLYVAASAILRQVCAKTDRIAFGPFIAGGLWLTWLYGPLVW